MNGYHPVSREEDTANSNRCSLSKGRSKWWWMQWLYSGLVEDRWSKRERHLSEIQRGNRSHLGGVFIKGNSGLD